MKKMLAAALLVLIVGAIFICYSKAMLDRRKAEGLLAVVKQLPVGAVGRADVLNAISRFSGYTRETTNEGLPEIEFSFDNHWLARLKLVPYTEFWGTLTFRDGILVRKHATEFIPASGCAAKVTERKRGEGFENGIAPQDFPRHTVTGTWNSPTNARLIYVENDNTYGEAQRRSDWTFNLSCLTRIGGCRDARYVLPGVVPPPYQTKTSPKQGQ